MGYARKFHKRLANETCNMLTFVLGAVVCHRTRVGRSAAGAQSPPNGRKDFRLATDELPQQRTASTADGKNRQQIHNSEMTVRRSTVSLRRESGYARAVMGEWRCVSS